MSSSELIGFHWYLDLLLCSFLLSVAFDTAVARVPIVRVDVLVQFGQECVVPAGKHSRQGISGTLPGPHHAVQLATIRRVIAMCQLVPMESWFRHDSCCCVIAPQMSTEYYILYRSRMERVG